MSLLTLAGLLINGCTCGPRLSSGSGSADGSSTGPDTSTDAATSPTSATTTELTATATDDAGGTTGDDDVPPWDGDDPSCGDGVPSPGVYCFNRLSLDGVENVLGVDDFDGDAHVDLLTRDGDNFVLHLGDGNGAFPMVESYLVPAPWNASMAGETLTAQMDDDLAPDIVVLLPVDDRTGRITVYRNDGSGLVFSPVAESMVEGNMQNFAMGAVLSIDGDGAQDYIGINNTLAVDGPVFQPALNDGAGVLTSAGAALTFEDFGTCGVMATAPVPAVGGVESGLVVVPGPCSDNPLSGAPLTVIRGNGAGDVSYATGPTTGQNPVAVASGDLDGDGRFDVGVWSSGWKNPGPDEDATLSVYLGDTAGGFALSAAVPADELCPGCPCPACGWVDPPRMLAGDLDGDGFSDLTLGAWTVTNVQRQASGVWLETSAKFLADFNEDGVDDVVTFFDGQLTYLLLSNP